MPKSYKSAPHGKIVCGYDSKSHIFHAVCNKCSERHCITVLNSFIVLFYYQNNQCNQLKTKCLTDELLEYLLQTKQEVLHIGNFKQVKSLFYSTMCLTISIQQTFLPANSCDYFHINCRFM